MSYFNPENRAEASDRLAVLTGVATGFAALFHSVNVWETLVSPAMAEVLQTVQLIGGVTFLMIFLPLFIWFKRARFAPVINPWKGESFLSDALRRAGFTGFAVMLVAGFVLQMLDRLLLSQITAATMLDISISAALALFCLSFFLYAFGPEGDGVEQGG